MAIIARRPLMPIRPIPGFLRRLMWFFLLWGGGVAAVGLLAFALRTLLKP